MRRVRSVKKEQATRILPYDIYTSHYQATANPKPKQSETVTVHRCYATTRAHDNTLQQKNKRNSTSRCSYDVCTFACSTGDHSI